MVSLQPAPPPTNVAPPAKPCGECSLCCKVLRINALEKPAGVWCPHFAKGRGCSIHETSPAECRGFQCYWSISEVLGDEWRPDRCKMVIWSNSAGRITVDVDPSAPGAWRREPFCSQLRSWTDPSRPMPLQVLVRIGSRLIALFPETEIDLGPEEPGRGILMGWEYDEEGRQVPYAAFTAI